MTSAKKCGNCVQIATAFLFVFLITMPPAVCAAGDDLLLVDHPEQYMVKKGDTLWYIAARFLSAPWRWREVWQQNPDVRDPDLIYPGDVISIRYIDGKPALMITDSVRLKPGRQGILTESRGNTSEYLGADGERVVKLSPKIRVVSTDTIQSIPVDVVAPFIQLDRIIESSDELLQKLQIIGGRDGRMIGGVGDRMFVRGELNGKTQSTYGIYRKGEALINPDTGESVGVMLRGVGTAGLKGRSQNGIFPIEIRKAKSDIRQNDFLLPVQHVDVTSFRPEPPADKSLNGVIVAVVDGVDQVGRLDTVVVSLGKMHKVKPGTVMAVTRQSLLRDSKTKAEVLTAPEKAGLLMIYKVFDRLSYALLLKASQPLAVGDRLVSPW